jgi:hypothetical protein
MINISIVLYKFGYTTTKYAITAGSFGTDSDNAQL